MKSRRAKVERSTSRNESLGEDSRRRRSQMRKKMWEEMEGKDSGVVGDDEGVSKDDIRDTMTHVTDDLKHEDVQGNYLTYSKSYLQSGAARHSQGFEDKNLGSSPGWWAATVATYCPSSPGELPKFLTSKPCE